LSTYSDFGYNRTKIPDISLKDLQAENSHYPRVGKVCLARCGGLFSTGLILVEATDCSSTIHRLVTSNISSSVWWTSELCKSLQDG